jgi:hypothetical protein
MTSNLSRGEYDETENTRPSDFCFFGLVAGWPDSFCR